MNLSKNIQRTSLRTVAAIAMLAAPTMAMAGGLGVREQSAQFQGSSFAGSAAGGGLGSTFWNSAAIGEVGEGWNFETGATLILGTSDFNALPGTSPFLAARNGSVTNDEPALVPSLYVAIASTTRWC